MEPAPPSATDDFAVIAVAASCEDASALAELLAHVDGASLALVVAPYGADAEAGELLSAVQPPWKGVKARPGVAVEAGHVYVVARGQAMTLSAGRLAPVARARRGATAAPVTALFCSLAEQQGPTAIGVFLSGSDGSEAEALRAIKARGGCAIVQDPACAIYDAAPRAALARGAADLVLTPKAIGHELSRIAVRLGEPAHELDATSDFEALDGDDEIQDEAFRRVLSLLKNKFRVDLSHYKLTTIRRRVLRRMTMSRFEHMAAYAEHLRTNMDALKALHDDLFIHVTKFFRDPESFRALNDFVFPALLRDRPSEDPIRIWVPGCSTGEEAYSIAIALTEFLEQQESTVRIQIFATDISDAAIDQARKATYPESLLTTIGAGRIERFFDRVKDGYKLRKELRDLCIISRHDVTTNPPFAKLDLISCRNVLIYFGPGLQKRIVPIFHYALKPTGFLWLGHSETPGGSSKLFSLIDKQNKIYAKLPAAASYLQLASNRFSTEKLEFPQRFARDPKGDDLQKSADQMVLFKYGPPGVVINSELEILQFRGRTAPLLEPPAGQPTSSLLKMARPDLLPVLRPLVQSAIKQTLTVRREKVVVGRRGARTALNIEIAPLNPLAPERERQYLILFEDSSPRGPAGGAPEGNAKRGRLRAVKASRRAPSADHYNEQLQQEIESLREYQQTLIEQFESSQEELTSANEELQATNEEFQSTNEELETAKEELQSANEELTTMNDELQSRNAELVSVNEKLARGEDRFRLMVEGVKEYAIYMLDPEGHVSSWNEGARRLKGYEASEIIGENYARFFTPEDIATSAPQLELEQARIEGRFEAEGWRSRKDGSQFWANVVLTRIDDSSGKLIGFSKVTRDLTERMRAEQDLRKANETLEQRVQERTRDLEHALRARDEFLSIASHELKTPLTTLKLQLQVARRGLRSERNKPWSPEQAASTFDRALKQTIALEELVEDLLDISRIQTGRLMLEVAEVDLARLVEDIAARFADQMAHAGAAIELRLENGIIGHWDPRRVSQVLVNLISNATKYAPGSAIHISTRRRGADAEIAVEDFGPGIGAQQQGTIFERFERGGASPNVGGLGLGLFIARRIVEAHQGTIRVESEVGRGSRFIVHLPLRPGERATEVRLEDSLD